VVTSASGPPISAHDLYGTYIVEPDKFGSSSLLDKTTLEALPYLSANTKPT